jgi:(2R)-sulfolactate sulfo-lyase subunit alpha
VTREGRSNARLLRLAPEDNVLIATSHLRAGDEVVADGVIWHLGQDVETGFKLASRDLAPGDVVLRLGFPIGEITAPVAQGAVVHVQNVKSRYLRTHHRGEA